GASAGGMSSPGTCDGLARTCRSTPERNSCQLKGMRAAQPKRAIGFFPVCRTGAPLGEGSRRYARSGSNPQLRYGRLRLPALRRGVAQVAQRPERSCGSVSAPSARQSQREPRRLGVVVEHFHRVERILVQVLADELEL